MWNKIEHRLFSVISTNQDAKPLVIYRAIINLIRATTTDTRVTVRCDADSNCNSRGIAIFEPDVAIIDLVRIDFNANRTTRSR